jgi:hypothetical protein
MTNKLLLICFFLFASCGTPYSSTNINELLENPPNYFQKKVTVEGQVLKSVNLFNLLKGYRLKDETGTIIIKTHKSVPLEGATVRVTGELKQLLKVKDNHVIYITESE